jgi:hypothetical protein
MNSELLTVTERIGNLVMAFYKERLATNPEFHAQDLVTYVLGAVTVAPNSPTRILQDMRKRGVLNYELLSRRQSFYRFLPLAAAVAA